MPIWTVKRRQTRHFEQALSFSVVASDETEAIALARKEDASSFEPEVCVESEVNGWEAEEAQSECRHCDGTIPFGRCYVCRDDMVLSFQGELNGEHVCSIDCINPDCEANE